MIIQSETKSTLMTDHEELFEKYIDYNFYDFLRIKNVRSKISIDSTIISYNEKKDCGGVTLKYKTIGKTGLGSKQSVDMVITKKIWKGVE